MGAMESLFKEWEKKVIGTDGDHFVKDGVICKNGWKEAKTKVLFILKETNDYEGSISELINKAVTIRPKSKLWARPTFHNIGRWAYGLMNYPESINDYRNAHKSRKDALLSCSFINLKKTTGGRSVSKEKLEYHAEKYKNELRKQIEIIAPDIIVFGGTFKTVRDQVLEKGELKHVAHRIHEFDGITCINANHPACTKKRTDMYDQVVQSYHKYLDTKKK